MTLTQGTRESIKIPRSRSQKQVYKSKKNVLKRTSHEKYFRVVCNRHFGAKLDGGDVSSSGFALSVQ